MDRQLIWTERASSDLEAIVRYLARRNPEAASRIGFGIYERAQILLQHPAAGTHLAELRNGNWHKLIYRRWKIFTLFAAPTSSSAECGRLLSVKRILRHRFEADEPAPPLTNDDSNIVFLQRTRQMRNMNLTVETGLASDGRWIAEIAQIPGALSYGTSRQEAISEVEAFPPRSQVALGNNPICEFVLRCLVSTRAPPECKLLA